MKNPKIAIVTAHENIKRAKKTSPETMNELQRIMDDQGKYSDKNGYDFFNLSDCLTDYYSESHMEEAVSSKDLDRVRDIKLFSDMHFVFFVAVEKSDVSRLLHLRRIAMMGYDYVVWMDSDLLLLKDFKLDMDVISSHAITCVREPHIYESSYARTKRGKIKKFFEGVDESLLDEDLFTQKLNWTNSFVCINTRNGGVEKINAWIDENVKVSELSKINNPNKYPVPWGRMGILSMLSVSDDSMGDHGHQMLGGLGQGLYAVESDSNFKKWIKENKKALGELRSINLSPRDTGKEGKFVEFVRKFDSLRMFK